MHDGIWVTDRDDCIIYMNPGMEKIAGVKAGAVSGLDVTKDFPSETTSEFLKFYYKTKHCLKPHEYEANVITPTGRKTVQSGWLIPRIKDNKYDGMICTIQDITERKNSEEALRSSEEKFRSVVEKASEGIMVIQNRKRVYCNPRWLEIVGYSAQEYDTIPLFSRIHPEDVDLVNQTYEKIRSRKPIEVTAEFRLITKTNEIKFLSARASLIQWENKDAGMVILEDITERKKAEWRKQKYIRELQFLSESAVQFVSLTHDKDIYTLIAEKIHEISENSIVAVNIYDEINDCVRVRALTGLGKFARKVSEIMGSNPVGRCFPLNDDAKAALGQGKLHKIPNGIYDISPGIPKVICQAIEKLLGLGDIYAMGLNSEGRLYGSVIIFTRNRIGLKNQELIETFLNQTAVAIRRWEADAALSRSEAKWRALTENSSDFIILIDKNETVKFINRTLQLTQEEIIGKSVYDFILPGYKDAAKKCIEDVFQTGQSREFETAYLINSGDILTFEARLGPVMEKNRVVAITVGARDVTQKKKAEEALIASEAKYKALFDNSIEGISLSKGNRIISANKALLNIFGYDSLDEFMKIPLFDHIAPESKEKARDIMMKREKGLLGRDFLSAYKFKCRDGKIKNIEVSGTKIQLGGEDYSLTTFRDITEKERIEEVLKENEVRYRELFDGINSGVAVYGVHKNGEQFIIKDLNQAGEGIEKIKKEDVIGKDVTEIFPGIEKFGLLDVFKKVWKSGNPEHYPIKFYKDERITGWRKNYVYKLSSDEIVTVYEDVTEKKKIEESILEYQKQLKSLASQLTLTEEKERYRIATSLHDQIGQYLAVSRMKLNELEYLMDSEEIRKILEQISQWLYQAIEQIRSLISDLCSPILYELGFEKAVAAWLNDEIQKKYNIQSKFYSDGLPKILDNDIQMLLFRDVRELLFNVIKHAHAKKVKVSICTTGNTIKVTVEDDGVGFNPEEAATTAAGGAKFGLFSIREKLEHFGGHLQIDSAPGKGSRVTLVAPLKS